MPAMSRLVCQGILYLVQFRPHISTQDKNGLRHYRCGILFRVPLLFLCSFALNHGFGGRMFQSTDGGISVNYVDIRRIRLARE